MKKSFLYILAAGMVGSFTLMSFNNSQTDEQQIAEKVENAKKEFLAAEDAKCKANALGAIQADYTNWVAEQVAAAEAAAAAASKSGGKKVTTTTPKKPSTTTPTAPVTPTPAPTTTTTVPTSKDAKDAKMSGSTEATKAAKDAKMSGSTESTKAAKDAKMGGGQ